MSVHVCMMCACVCACVHVCVHGACVHVCLHVCMCVHAWHVCMCVHASLARAAPPRKFEGLVTPTYKSGVDGIQLTAFSHVHLRHFF